MSVSDLLLEPVYVFEERRAQGTIFSRGPSGFRPGHSLVGFTWRRDRLLSAQAKVGSKSLLGRPSRYGSAEPLDEIGLIEAYGQLDSDYGRLRGGLVPIPFGLEGGDAESRLKLPRSLLFQSRLVNLRDYGVSYRITFDGFFSDWAAHNGEGGPDLDGETWMTARWGWQGFKFLRIGVSGTAGRTSPESTQPVGSTHTSDEAGLDIGDFSRVRIANAFLWWDTRPIRLALEGSTGDVRQRDRSAKLRSFHADLEVEAGESLSFLSRYDTIDPRDDRQGDTITEVSFGLAWRSAYENSVVTLVGTKRFQEDPSAGAHRVQLAWRLTPSILQLHSFL